jgi:CRP/FNR family transcriptional regulator, cyclic AMP receptor protein
MTGFGALRTVPLLSRLRDSDLDTLSGLLKPRDCAKSKTILFANDSCDALYIVLTGQVKVSLIAEDGREVILSLVRQGDFFGEMALMDDEPYSTSMIAMEDSRLLILHRDDFRRCIAEIPGMSFGLLRALCGRLRENDNKIGGLMLLDVTGRVAHLFLELAAQNNGDEFPDPPTHQVIAQMVGSSRETVSRTISSLISQDFIEMSRGGARILNRKALEAAAGNMLRRMPKPKGEDGVRGAWPSPRVGEG